MKKKLSKKIKKLDDLLAFDAPGTLEMKCCQKRPKRSCTEDSLEA